jgi:hypothetical protein
VSSEQQSGATEQASMVAPIPLLQFASSSYANVEPTTFVTMVRTVAAKVESSTQLKARFRNIGKSRPAGEQLGCTV